MTSRDFAYWLQGFFEIAQPETATAEQLAMIKQHLSLVFVHEIDPSQGGPEEQAKLNGIHSPPPPHLLPTQPGAGGPVARC